MNAIDYIFVHTEQNTDFYSHGMAAALYPISFFGHKMYHFKIYGNEQLLSRPAVAVHASRRAPEGLFRSAQRFFSALLSRPVVIGSGWHSPLEKSLLAMFASQSTADLLIFLAKPFEKYRLPVHLKRSYDRQKIAILEPDISRERISRISVNVRDRLIDDLIDRHIFLHIDPQGKLAKRFEALEARDAKIFVLDHAGNRPFFQKGVRLIDEDTVDRALSG